MLNLPGQPNPGKRKIAAPNDDAGAKVVAETVLKAFSAN
jgi:hypothetical protein